MNATIARLSFYWEQVWEKGQPKTSPAAAALRDVLFMGRSTMVNVIAVAQMLTARAIGGPEAREKRRHRVSHPVLDQRLEDAGVGGCNPPKRSSVLGRWQVVKAGTAHECQVVYLTDQEARGGGQWAAQGTGRLGHLGVPERSSTTLEVAKRSGHVPYLSLRDAMAYLPGPPLTYEALRKHSHRDARFPEPVGWEGSTQLLDLDALCGWRREKWPRPTRGPCCDRRGVAVACRRRGRLVGEPGVDRGGCRPVRHEAGVVWGEGRATAEVMVTVRGSRPVG